MDNTPNLALPYIASSQAQKHVTHNEAIRTLDALVQISVQSRKQASPPDAPENGVRYIISETPSQDWAGQSNTIAAFQDGAWVYFSPGIGWVAWVIDEAALIVWDGSAWVPASSGSGGPQSVNPVDLVGINATADTTNRLSLSSPASLFNHEGTDHRINVNKSAATDTASLIFQTEFSGRAEFGLTGDDDWRVKVSPDGATWHDALVVDRKTGAVQLPNTPGQSASSPVYFLGLSDNSDVNYATNTIISLSSDTAVGGKDSHSAFNTETNTFTVPETGLYNCTLAVRLRQIPSAGWAGIKLSHSQDNGSNWTDILKIMTNVASHNMASNTAFVNLDAGDLISMRCNAPSGSVAKFWGATNLSLFRMA